MHKAAIEYDRERGVDNRFSFSDSGLPRDPAGFVPEGRPCDWCGETVDKGYIHDHCRKSEADLWLDILY